MVKIDQSNWDAKEGFNNSQAVFAQVLKNTQRRGKIAPRTFKFILPFILAKKIELTTYPGGRVSFQSWEAGGGVIS